MNKYICPECGNDEGVTLYPLEREGPAANTWTVFAVQCQCSRCYSVWTVDNEAGDVVQRSPGEPSRL